MSSPHLAVRCVALAFALTLAAQVDRAAGQGSGQSRPEELTLPTKDGVQIRATYYPSSAGQQATPVVMLPDYNESRAVFDQLARMLSSPTGGLPAPPAGQRVNRSRAVITVDLRGQGDSKTAYGPNGAVKLDVHRFAAADFQDMVLQDMEAVRSFLVAENDAERLNLNELCLVGSGLGANVAVLWAAKDWATPPLPVRKQSQDVKALVLISPRWNSHGLMLVEAMKFPPIQRRLSIMLAYGAEDRDTAADCENLDKTFSRFHPEPRPNRAGEKSYFLVAAKTKLQGSELLINREFGLAARTASFIEARLGSQEFPFVPRLR